MVELFPERSMSLPGSLLSFQEELTQLRQKVSVLEGNFQKFSKVISVADFIDRRLPQQGLPLGCVHEIHGVRLAQAIAFASLISNRIKPDGNVLFVAPNRSFYPLGLLPFHIDCKNWLHVRLPHANDRHWTVLEALRCHSVTAVLGVIAPTDLTFCRQLQLAAENSGATCFILGSNKAASTASVITRWKIAPHSSDSFSGFQRSSWKIDLAYCRGGQPESWEVICRGCLIENAKLSVAYRGKLAVEESVTHPTRIAV